MIEVVKAHATAGKNHNQIARAMNSAGYRVRGGYGGRNSFGQSSFDRGISHCSTRKHSQAQDSGTKPRIASATNSTA